MTYPKLLRPVMVASSLAQLSLAAYPEISSDRCDCFLTNGSSSHYFTSHKFFDFRDKSNYAGVPALLGTPEDSSQADATSDYFVSDEWTENWGLQTWNNSAALASTGSDASVFMVHSPNNVYIEKNEDENADSDTYLTMRTARLKDFQSASEFESKIHNYHFLSVRMYARTLGAPGAVTAMFTYRELANSSDLAKVQESDLEIRTLDPPDYVQYTNQPSYTSMGLDLQEATRNVTIPDKRDWTNWAVYRMDWSPDATTWFIDGNEVASISFQTPRDPSMIIFNSWSDGGSWTGNMSVGSEAKLQIKWIELVYNKTETTSSRHKRTLGYLEKRDDSCYTVCSIDQTQDTGTAVVLQGSVAKISSFGGVLFWASVLSLALTFW
ncbi:glycoside hydrolase family 16 protein [Hypoxylon trugodes]|uniref:glycoside hydrolase family 16 protein n=1 Tax=Hypoxylon trugodes TaxID=326681 RepID=UPI00219765F1|nr:glycoside hydrolase family 16 protein [Hypoxylon trugodes]KAI1393441.1 glycoside hydrolase family 16 protein [Hypoxylon trugodes]